MAIITRSIPQQPGPRVTLLSALLVATGACGDPMEGRETESASAGSLPASVSNTNPGSASMTTMTMTGTGTGGTDTASATGSTSLPDPTTSETSESDSDSSSSTSGEICDGPPVSNIDSFIWIANSNQNTISKIDTKTGAELGRYQSRPENGGSPSRTSVNTAGMVAVANRLGGVAAFHAKKLDCVESNGEPGIQTSTGAGDVLPWGQDECLAWYTPLNHPDNRPVAWTSGELNYQTCEIENRNVWTAASNQAAGTAVIYYLDGDDGSILQQIPVPDLPEAHSGWYGFYGGAVDAENNFWATQLQGGKLIRVDSDTFTYTLYSVPDGAYGMTVTADGYIWYTGRGTHRFNPQTETWDSQPLLNDSEVHTGGCMGDGDSILYRGSYSQIHGIDTQTMQVVKTLNVGQPGDDHIWGVAVDYDGFVWGVPRNGTRAYKVDPESGQIVLTVEGLSGAYTYSDMTGFALGSLIPG